MFEPIRMTLTIRKMGDGNCRAAYRNWVSPDYWHDYLGFRLAVVPSGE